MGVVPTPQKNNETRTVSLLDNLLATKKDVEEVKEKIASLVEKIADTSEKIDKEQLERKLIRARIDLVEAETSEQFLEEEYLATEREDSTEKLPLLAENY